MALLVAGLRRDCQEVILEGCSGVVWESYKVDPFVKKMAEQVYAFQDKVEELLQIDEEVCTLLSICNKLCNVPFSFFSQTQGVSCYQMSFQI